MKTTPTLGLKLYDGTDAPDLVSGYNASMSTLDRARVMHRRGDLSLLRPDLNSLSETGYYNANGYTFTKENHGPVGSHNSGILVVYDRCNDPNLRNCATQQYFPRNDGTGDAYRPMTRVLTDGKWSAWTPLVDVPDVEGALPANGAAGQVLVKSSASDYDCEWTDPSALNTMVSYNGNTNCLSANGTEVAALKMRSIEGFTDTASTGGLLLNGASGVVRAYTGTKSGDLEPTGLTIRAANYSTSYTLGTGRGELTNIGKINGRAPVGMSNYVILSGSHAAGADYAELVAAGINVVKLGAGGIYLAAATVSLKGVATVNNIPATAGIARATTDNIEVTVNVVAPIPAQQTVVNVPIRFQVSKTAPTIVTVGKNDGDYTLLTCAVTPMSYPS